MTKAFYITAAPVGAVPRYLDPQEPKFIPGWLLEHLLPRVQLSKTRESLYAEGWETVEAGGIALRSGFEQEISNADLLALDADQQITASSALTAAGWVPSGAGWKYPDESIKPHCTSHRIGRDLLGRISSCELIQRVVLLLTTFGWTATPNGDLVWEFEKIHSYLPAGLVNELQKQDATILTDLASVGWTSCESGFWQPGKARSAWLPVTAQAIVRDSLDSIREGAAIIHLHTRSTEDHSTLSIPGIGGIISTGSQQNHIVPKQYEYIIPRINSLAPTAILNLSTSARGDQSTSQSPLRRAHLKHYGPMGIGPDLASFSPAPVIFQGGGGYDNPHGFLDQQLAHFRQAGVRPEIEVFNHTIVENAITIYREVLTRTGVPVLFMLVAGVDQYRRDPISGKVDDDSLINVAVRKKVTYLLAAGDTKATSEAVRLVTTSLQPQVERLRQHFPASKISVLLPGALQAILVDVAIALDLDGIRVGLEDGLNISDENLPGGIRKARGTADQVRALRKELEHRGIAVTNAETLRDQLGILRPEVALFKRVSAALRPYLGHTSNSDALPSAAVIVESVTPLLKEYVHIEDRFVERLKTAVGSLPIKPHELADLIYEIAWEHGINIRFFIEELDRYVDHEHLIFSDVYIPQTLNFARELFALRRLSIKVFDEALANYARPGKTVNREDATYAIHPDQFKPVALRFLEYLTSIPCRYNKDRTNVYNIALRRDLDYNATMAVLFHAIRELMLNLRARSHAHAKAYGPVWSVVSTAPVEPDTTAPRIVRQVVTAHELPSVLPGIEWIVLPSTPTTNYPLGLKLAHGLASAFYDYLADILHNPTLRTSGTTERSDILHMLGITHSGRQADGETVIEASMLFNRFALNADSRAQLFNHPSRLIYERLLLPRLVKNPRELAYARDQLVERDETGYPVYKDGRRAARISSDAINHLTFLKLFAHSSGISTAQQLDILMRLDAQRFGFDGAELQMLFDRILIISFGSASEVKLDWAGTSVVDITAYNDIRSLAGTITDDYLVDPGESLEKLNQTLKDARTGILPSDYCYGHSPPIWSVGVQGKTLARLSGVFLLDDPVRLHDGHSIRRYLEASPVWLKRWLREVYHAPAAAGAAAVLRALRAGESSVAFSSE